MNKLFYFIAFLSCVARTRRSLWVHFECIVLCILKASSWKML